MKGDGDWTRYRSLPGEVDEVDFHDGLGDPSESSYDLRMSDVYARARDSLKSAHATGKDWVLFRHGSSTSRPGKITARSVIRGLMRSKESTPYLNKKESIQHRSVFVARIRPRTISANALKK